MRTQSLKALSEVQKVWYYVMNIIHRSAGHSVMIPSSNELAKEFGIARSTVRIALEKLTAQEALITRRGIGTFTNPKWNLHQESSSPKLIGLLLFDGGLFSYSPLIQQELAVFCQEIARNNWHMRLITESAFSSEDIEQILTHSYLDGLFILGSSEEVIRKAADIVPLVNFDQPVSGVTTVRPDYAPLIPKILKISDSSLPLHMLWLQGERIFLPEDWIRLNAVPQLTHDLYPFVVHHAYPDESLRAKLAERFPDWIVLHTQIAEKVRNFLIDIYGEEQAKSSRFIYSGEKQYQIKIPGYYLISQRLDSARKGTELLRSMMEDGYTEIFDHYVPVRLFNSINNLEVE